MKKHFVLLVFLSTICAWGESITIANSKEVVTSPSTSRSTAETTPDRHVVAGVPKHSKLNLKCTVDGGTFARFEPFADGREIVVRRGSELGFNYGIEKSRQKVLIKGFEFDLITFESGPSCTLFLPKGAPVPKFTDKVLMLPDEEILIESSYSKFTDAEIRKIFNAVSFN